jgi:hypothetical protein
VQQELGLLMSKDGGDLMKMRYVLLFFCFLLFTGSAYADSIVKVPLGESGPDLIFDGTTLHTVDSGDASTPGDQNTRVVFSGFGDLFADIITPTASFSLLDVLAVNSPTVTSGVITQETSGGTFALYAPDNTLLLSGTLDGGAITGTSGGVGSGSYFNTAFGTFTGGTLASYLVADSAGISFALDNIISSSGMGLYTSNGALEPFTASASGIIRGADVPEPATAGLLLMGLGSIGAFFRRAKEQ